MKKLIYLLVFSSLILGVAFICLRGVPTASTADREQASAPVSAAEVHSPDSPAPAELLPAAVEAAPAAHPAGCPCPLHKPAAAKPERPADKVMALPEPIGFLNSILSADLKVANIPLPGGRLITGNVSLIQNNDDGIWLVQGTMDKPEAGRFMFMRQTIQGVAGDMVGFVLYDESDVAYKVLPEGKDGAPVLAEVSADEIICRGYVVGGNEEAENIEEVEDAEDTMDPQFLPQTHPRSYPIPPDENNIIQLQSLPDAEGVVYLDFDGEERDFIGWGYINALPAGVTNSQIFTVWQGVSEDFQPFNLNVTTVRSVYDNAPRGQRIHVVITETTNAAPGAGGVAFLNSFNWDSDPVCWSFYVSGKDAVEVISHEIGHTVGLLHHGRTEPAEEYYLGENGWAPIMGAGYRHPVTQWSKGEYLNANKSSQDDLLIITTQNNGVDYRDDDHGDTYATASYLEISEGGGVSNEGIIERSTDRDAFRFSTTGGRCRLDFKTVSFNANLDIGIQLIGENGSVILNQAPTTSREVSINQIIPAGNYYVLVYGTGKGSPTTPGGYSNYASLGGYQITGNISGGVHSDRLSIAENSPNGTVVGSIAPRADHGAGAMTYSISSGNTNGVFAIDPATGAITVANSAALDYEALSSRWDDPAKIELFISVTDSLSVATESIRTVVTVLDVNEPPVFLPNPPIRIPEYLEMGTKVATVKTEDPDRFDFATYAIVGGNRGGAFTINSFGEIIVAGALIHKTQPSYSIVVEARDKYFPVNTITATVEINLVEIDGVYPPGSIIRTVYSGISGTDVSDLTNNVAFPDDFTSKESLPSFDAGLDRGEIYGATMRGYLIAPETGDYTFWIASSDASQLWISTNASLDNAALQASVSSSTDPYEWTLSPSQESVSLSLVQGQVYYIEARHKAGFGDDHLAVAWSGPGFDREVIPGMWLAPFDPDGLPRVVISNPNEDSVDIPENVGLLLECVPFGPNGSTPDVFWTQVSGPGDIIFGSPDQSETSAMFPEEGSYVVRVSATDGVNTGTDEIIVRTSSTVGSGLAHTRYGADTTGSYQVNGEIGYTITGASTGIPLIDHDDGFQLLGQVFQGDFNLITRVAAGSNVAANHERMGLIVRQGLDPVSNGVSAYIGYRTSTNWGHFIRRQKVGDANRQNSYENTGIPGFVRLARIGSTVSAYHSYDEGQSWVYRGNIDIPGPVRAGLCWSSSSKSQSGFATFENLEGFAPGNLAPSVNAGADQEVEVSTSITLNGSVSDDGFPVDGGGVNTLWTRVSGPGSITFSDPQALATDVICDTAGVHVIRLTANDGGAITFDEMVLTVTGPEILPIFSAPVLAGFSAAAGASFEGITLAELTTLGTPMYVTNTTEGISARNTGGELVFTKISGPSWLEITEDGQLKGEPRLGDGGKNSFVVQATNDQGQMDQATLEIDVTLTPMQSWKVTEFGLEAAENEDVSGDLIDGDKDGFVNLMEYALNTLPETPDTPEIEHGVIEIDGAHFLQLTIIRNPDAHDLDYVVQVTSNPSDQESWTHDVTEIQEDTSERLVVRDTVGGASRFIRLKVAKKP